MKNIDEPLTIVIQCHNCDDTAAILNAEPCECHDGVTKEPLFGMHFNYNFIGIGRNGHFLSGALGEEVYRGLKDAGAAYFDSKTNLFHHFSWAGFYCSICSKSYCHKCWKNQEKKEIGGVEATIITLHAECPMGHQSEIDEEMH